jgi:formyl-CoA transferase
VLHTFKNVKGVERDVTVLSAPFRLAHDGPQLTSPPPLVGEHSDAILGELGYAAGDIERLRRDGVV